MSTTNFTHDSGGISSNRTTSGMHSLTSYTDSSRGGITSHVGNFTYRLNNSGQCIGSSLTVGHYSTYFGRNGSVSSRLTAF